MRQRDVKNKIDDIISAPLLHLFFIVDSWLKIML